MNQRGVPLDSTCPICENELETLFSISKSCNNYAFGSSGPY